MIRRQTTARRPAVVDVLQFRQGRSQPGDRLPTEQGLADILGTRRVIEPVRPRLVLADRTAWLVIPDEVGYPL